MNNYAKNKFKLGLVVAIFLAFFLLFFFKILDIQLVNGAQYDAELQKNIAYSTPIESTRGEIVDRNGIPIATSRIGHSIVVNANFYSRETINAVILKINEMLIIEEETYNGNIPLTHDGGKYVFTEDRESEILGLKTFLGLQSYATERNVINALISRYDIDENDPQDIITIAEVRYEMEKLEFSPNNPFKMASDISVNTVIRVSENAKNYPGIEILSETIRYYPNQNIASNIIGTIGPIYKEDFVLLEEQGYNMNDLIGKSGIEELMELELSGTDGVKETIKSTDGSVVSVQTREESQPGNSVKLTIDIKLQNLLEAGLEYHIDRIAQLPENMLGEDVKGGAAVVIDVRNGDILGLANYPTFNLETYTQDYDELLQDPLSPLYNRALFGQYSPGSTFKPIVATAGLEEEIIEYETRIYCDGVYTYFADYQPKCLDHHGNVNVIDALAVSCNEYFYEVGRLVGINDLEKWAVQYGLGQPTGVELPEKIGIMSGIEEREASGGVWLPGDTVQAAIGQSDTKVTPLQLASYAATLANGGTRYNTSIVDSIVSFNQVETLSSTKSTVASNVDASDETFAILKEGMQATVAQSYSRYLTNLNFTVAAKTGTSQDGPFSNAIFICYAPVENPEIAISIAVERGGYGYNVLPFAEEILRYYFDGDVPEYAIDAVPDMATFSYE